MAVQERVKFPGDPIVQETGAGDGAAPQIPLDKHVQPTQVQMLNKGKKAGKNTDDDDDDGDGDEGEGEAVYSRETIGARIGQGLEDNIATAAHAKELDADDVVPCLFPHAVQLQDQGLMHKWAAGVHMVPVSIAGATPKERHWWLKRNRVRHAGKPIARADMAGAGNDEDDE